MEVSNDRQNSENNKSNGNDNETFVDSDILRTPSQTEDSPLNRYNNLTYVELITLAIEKSPYQRLKVRQIYRWLQTNVSFFNERSESPEREKWQNTIRHTLSVHNRFVRIELDEGTVNGYWIVDQSRPGRLHSHRRKRRRKSALNNSS
ncbi:hypothetical protein ACOME3_001152 [Neoechinorhynchus agilis]